MGDVLHALPAVAALRERMPGCTIGWAVEPHWRELLVAKRADEHTPRGDERPIVDRVHSVRTREWSRSPFSFSTLGSILRLRRKLRAERYDVCVDLQGSIRSSIVGWISGAGLVVGPDKPREGPARWFYGRRVATVSPHVVDQACEILGAAMGKALTPVEAKIPLRPSAERWWAEFTALAGFATDARYVMIAPTAGWGSKEWPPAGYQVVATALAARGYTVLVNAASSNDGIPKRVADGGAAKVVACNLAQMISMTRRAKLVIGGDTGPVHLAATLGRPVLALYGPTDPARTGPYGPDTRVLRHASSTVDHRRIRETEGGLLKITADEVLDAAFDLLGEEHDG